VKGNHHGRRIDCAPQKGFKKERTVKKSAPIKGEIDGGEEKMRQERMISIRLWISQSGDQNGCEGFKSLEAKSRSEGCSSEGGGLQKAEFDKGRRRQRKGRRE